MRAVGFHRRGVESGAVRPAGERQTRQDLAVLGAQNHHHGLGRLGGRISRIPAGREQHIVLRVQGEPVAPALVPKGVVRDRLHRLDVDGRNTALRVLHDHVEHAFAVAHALLRHAAQIDGAEHGAVLGVDHRRVLGRVAEDVDSLVERIEVDAVRLCGARIDGLDERHGLGVKHRDGLAAGEAMARLRVDRGAIASDTGNLAGRFQGVEIEDGQPGRDAPRLASATRDVQTASGDVGIDIVPPALTAHLGPLEHLVRPGLLSQSEGPKRHDCHCQNQTKLSHASSSGPSIAG